MRSADRYTVLLGAVCVALAGVTCGGCNRETVDSDPANPPSLSEASGRDAAGEEAAGEDGAGEDGAGEDGAGERAPEITIRAADRAAYDDVIEGYRGSVVLVDFWATWCEPCKEKFPTVVTWSREFEDEGLRVVSLSLDGEDDEAKALEFLREQQADFVNLRSVFGLGSRSAREFELPGGVPFYKLYDREGTLRHEFSSLPDGLGERVEHVDRMEERLRALLEEPGAG